MTDTVHVLVIGEGEAIDCMPGAYANEKRAQQAVAAIEAIEAVAAPSEWWVDYRTLAVNHADPY